MLYLFIATSFTLLLVSLTVHLLTFSSFPITEHFPSVWMLHVLVFAVFIPAIFYGNRIQLKTQKGQNLVMNAAPAWIRTMTGFFFAYALINFVLFFLLIGNNSTSIRDGKYTLHSKGRNVREVSKEEYYKYDNRIVRGFSGHWMLFYSASLLMLAGYLRLREAESAGGLEDVVEKIEMENTSEEENKTEEDYKLPEEKYR